MNIKKLAGMLVFLLLAGVLMVACSGQQGSVSKTQGDTASTAAVSNAAASSEAIASNGLEEKAVRVATTEEDYKIFGGYPDSKLYLTGGKTKQVPVSEKIYVATNDVDSTHGYYMRDNLSNTIKDLYYSASELPALNSYGRLIGTYGDVPVVEIDRKADRISGKGGDRNNLKIHRCKLVGCTVAFVGNENAIWNQNDLISVSDLGDLQFTDPNGRLRSSPMDWEFGEEVVVECNGQVYQTQADSYVYFVDDEKTEIAGGDTKVTVNGITDTVYGYDVSKLDPGLYYFEDLGVYKVV